MFSVLLPSVDLICLKQTSTRFLGEKPVVQDQVEFEEDCVEIITDKSDSNRSFFFFFFPVLICHYFVFLVCCGFLFLMIQPGANSK